MYSLKIRLHGKDVQEIGLEPGRQYTFGRGSECDVVLEAEPGISRTHFRLTEENNVWTVQVLSKFGEVRYGGQATSNLTLEAGHAFELAGYDFLFEQALSAQNFSQVVEDSSIAENVSKSSAMTGPANGIARNSSGQVARSTARNGAKNTAKSIDEQARLLVSLSTKGTRGLVPSLAKASGQDSSYQTESPEPSRTDSNRSANGTDDVSGKRFGQRALAVVPRYEQRYEQHFDGNDEVTRVAEAVEGLPYLKVVDANGAEEILKLEGSSWVAGREDGCEILLNDRKASRRQFELSSSAQGFFIRDLGSSNGTVLNGVELASDELRPLRSGDLIVVGKVKMTFEIRDPAFEQRLQIIPPEVLNEPPIVEPSPYEMINYPVPNGPGGAVRYQPAEEKNLPVGWQAWLKDSSPEQRKKKFRLALIASIIVLLFGYFYFGTEQQVRPAANDLNTPFARLTPQKQQLVREKYVLGRNLFLQSKPDLALDQFNKLHEILPEGYEESRTMADKCRDAIKNAEEVRALEISKRELAEHRRVAEQTIAKCMPIAHSTLNMADLDSCLAPALEFDPNNPQLSEMKTWVQQRISSDESAKARQRVYEQREQKGNGLFAEAEKLEAKGEIFEAMAAYQRHIDSPYPDPQNLKLKSQKNLLSIQKKITAKIDDELANSQQAFTSQNYKEAISHVLKAKALDPKNERAAELNAKIRHEVNSKCKEIYEEAIIAEGLGNPDKGVELWKKIIDMDAEDGDYYRKAKSKLKKYGKF